MIRTILAALLSLALTGPALAADTPPKPADKPADKADKAAKADKPRVEVVFCLDTTGSMSGLIQGAKDKIWAMCNQIASGQPVPQLRIGLVAYRDKGDAYVTRVIDLTDDLDAIHGELAKFQAQGGGDGPESVNQALDDAVHKIKWAEGKDVLKLIFLVGDAPPHMDYSDDVKYPATCQKAVAKNIIINTIQCGGDAECRKAWQDICTKGEGTYVQIAQQGGVVAVATPFDKRLGEINRELARSTVVYGAREKQATDARRLESAAGLAPAAAAERAAFAGKAGRVAAFDLLDDIRDGKVKLEQLKKEELPEELRNLTAEEQKAHLEKLQKRRAELAQEALELDKKRAEYIKQELARTKKDGKDAFDSQVIDTLQKQAAKFNIKY